ncbi:MAG TPA: PhoD-like phosphatase N-terminal domain-containing protein, partial [Nevskia sp.]|nr:PhoD-like phosphatase N-terminal domain-containing protein [Nevskia sp.]
MPPLSRRDLLKTAAALVPASLGGCASDDGDGGGGGATLARFDHGVASGDPTAGAVILWTRATPLDIGVTRLPVDWLIARDPALREVVA